MLSVIACSVIALVVIKTSDSSVCSMCYVRLMFVTASGPHHD